MKTTLLKAGTSTFCYLTHVFQVEELISNTRLNITSEEKVFLAVLNWVRHDLNTREKHISRLMRHVRLPLVTRDFLVSHVDSDNLIRDNPECKEYLLEAMRYHLLPEQRAMLANERTTLRRPEGLKPYLFAIGEREPLICKISL